MIENVLRVFEMADEIDLKEGMIAYERYRELMDSIARHFCYSVEQTAGAFAALSPNNDYLGNLRSLYTICSAHRQGIPADRVTVSTYNACKLRAWKCLEGIDFLSFTEGPKTRNFYTNIVSPDIWGPVTIDGHMFSVWLGKRMTMKAAVYAKFNYEDVAHGFRSAAFRLCIRPNQVQAVCWFTWKRIHRVVFNPQLGMFQHGDQWGLMQDPSSIKPFPFKEGNA